MLTELGLGSNPVSLSLRNQLAEEFWVRASDRRTPTHQITSDLVKTLNQFVFSGRAWSFDGLSGKMALSKVTLDLQGQIRSVLDTIRFNRLLLEDTLPGLIGKTGIDVRNHLSETPLHLAAFDARLPVCATLIDHGAAVNATNRSGVTPLDLALFGKEKGRHGDFAAVIALLKEKGGKAATVAFVEESGRTGTWLASSSQPVSARISATFCAISRANSKQFSSMDRRGRR